MRCGALALAVLYAAAVAAQDNPPAETPAPAPAAEPAEAQPPETVPTVPVAEDAAAAPPVADEPAQLDSIEVTAQRRKQRLVDVPLAVTALTQDQVEARGLGRLDDLNSLAPGLQVSRSPADTTISQLAIRGSSQINPAIYWDPAVGVYLDGVYIGKGQGSIFDIVDLAGIEVLRGPQGTLYGRNTIAGTVNFLTREPSGNFSGHVSAEPGSYAGRVYKASMDLPRIGIADVTLGVRQERRDPWVVTTPGSSSDGLNDRHSDGAHATALLDLAQGLEALYRVDYSETDQAMTFLQLVHDDDAALAPYVARERLDRASIDSPATEYSKVEGHGLTLTWEAQSWLTVKSITGYRKVKWVDQLDLDGTPDDIAHSKRDTDYDQKSQDLNLSGGADGWHYTLGYYYFADEGFTNNPIHAVTYQQGNRIPPLDLDSRYGTRSKARAAYGQLDWTPGAPLTLSAGARRTTEKKELDRLFGFSTNGAPYTYYINDDPNDPTSSGLFHASGVEYDATTPMGSIAWRVLPELNAYVRYAAGFKSGGYNGEFSDVQGTPQSNRDETNTPFRPEKQRSLEVGAKSSFWDGRALVNVAAFRNKLQDLQASIFTATGAAASVVRNAGRATVRGVELETAVVVVTGTTVRANHAWLNSRYDEFQDAECDNATPKNCVDGNWAANRAFVHAPRRSWNLVADSELWHAPWGALRAVADYAWTDSFYTYPYQLRPVDNAKQVAGNTLVPAYGLLNARLSFTDIPLGGTRRAEVALWGRNLLDEDAPSNFIDFGPGFDNLIVANFVEPRVLGASFQLHW